MNWDHSARGVGFQVGQILQSDASAARIERSEIEVEELAVSPDVGTLELTDLGVSQGIVATVGEAGRPQPCAKRRVQRPSWTGEEPSCRPKQGRLAQRLHL